MVACINCRAYSQQENRGFKSFSEFKESLFDIAKKNDQTLEKFWKNLKKTHQIPFIIGDSVAFLYKGKAKEVEFQGDFNGWGANKNTKVKAKKLGESDIWFLEQSFPEDSRIDYKIVLDNKKWILDPENSFTQMSGFGPNSELRMPRWVYPEETIKDKSILKGTKSRNKLIKSKYLRYNVNYFVYTPANYKKLSDLPVVYVTDGHEYADDAKGSMIIILDNLIDKKKIEPVIAVFIDPREPSKPKNNRRQSEYVLNENFTKFVCDEVVPLIDKNYRTNPEPESRAILGTSLGGINSTYFGVIRPDVFKLIAIQSPAYWHGTKLYDIYKDKKEMSLKMFISAGTFNDGMELTEKVKNDFIKRGCDVMYKVVNEGHSWGNWRALLDDMLIFFWGVKK